MRGLKGKKVLVTGGASGIGQATAARFMEEGCVVSIIDYSADARERVAEELPGLAAIIDADVSDMEQVRIAFQKAVDAMGSVDVLINNAGISIRHGFLDITSEEWDTVLGVNLTGVFNVAQTAARHMMEKGSGVIINALALRSAPGDFAARASAFLRTSCASVADGKTSVTSPASLARAASQTVPSIKRSDAAARPRRVGNSKLEANSGARARSAKGVLNAAFSEA